MAGHTNAPLSGDVTQAINPWTWFARIAGSQMGFINIHQTTTGDADLEREIVENVAGYGRQLGRITEAMAVLVEQADTSELDAEARQALASFQDMAERIELTKQRRRQAGSPLGELDQVLGALQALREEDPDRYHRELQKVKNALGLADASVASIGASSASGAER